MISTKKQNTESLNTLKSANKAYRFDLFTGEIDENGKVKKERSVGYALIFDGSSTYQIYLRMFLNDQFYLLAEKRNHASLDYQILTRQASQAEEARKFNWFVIGAGKVLSGFNQGLMQLKFDLLGNEKIFMSLYPTEMEAKEGKSDKFLKIAS